MEFANDKDIVAGIKSDNKTEQAFKFLVEKYQERLYMHIRKMVISHADTDDLLQETFIKAYRGIDKFREDSSLFTWLYRIATNETLNFIKKKKRSYVFTASDYEDQLILSLKGDEYFDGDEAAYKLQQAILKLPEKQRLVFNMKYYDDLKYDEISEILNTSVGALKASYHHAVKKIEENLRSE
jgi:RNA polymerase sigma-70 factor, ECF subfamily